MKRGGKKRWLGVLTLLEKQHTITYKQEGSQLFSCCASVAHPPRRKWLLIIELLLMLSITNDTLSTVMKTFCWESIWLTGRWWSWPFGALSNNMFMDTEANRGWGTPSSEHSVVTSVEGKTTLCLKWPFCWFNTVVFFFFSHTTVQLQCSVVKQCKLAVCYSYIQTYWVKLSSDTCFQIFS